MRLSRSSKASLALCWCLAAVGDCASLTLPDQVAVPGQVILAPLSLSSQGQVIAGVQFDLAFDAGLSVRLLPGAQLGSSGKTIYTAALPTGGFRVLIIGMNQGGIGDGDLLRAVIAVDPGISPGTAQIRLSNAVATDANGTSIPLSAAPATVQVQAASGTVLQSFVDGAVVSAASLLPGPISPGEIVTILGRSDLAATASVTFNGTKAPILYAGPGQVNAIAPFGLDLSGNTILEVRGISGSLGTAPLPLTTVAPALFTQNAAGTGPAVALNQDYTPNSFSNPAPAGSIVMFYGTGFGPLVPAAVDGQPAPGPASTVMPVTAMIAGVPAEVMYAGAAPGLIAGVVQINVRIPGIIPNPDAAVSLTIDGVSMPSGVTVSVR